MQPFQRTAAVFDIDDSLLDGNAGTIFTWFLYSNREMAPQARSQVPRALYDYARKRLSEADMVALGSKCQQGIRADRNSCIAAYDEPLRDGLEREGRDGIEALQDPKLGESIGAFAAGARPESPRPPS